jgi:hypothetical protein
VHVEGFIVVGGGVVETEGAWRGVEGETLMSRLSSAEKRDGNGGRAQRRTRVSVAERHASSRRLATCPREVVVDGWHRDRN